MSDRSYFMRVEDVITQYNPLYPEPYSWGNTVEYLMNTPHEAQVVNRLMEILYTYGSFREPVTLGTGAEAKFVYDGTHRIVASIVSGAEHVRVQDEFPPYDPESYDFEVFTTITRHDDDPGDETLLDCASNELRSLEISDSLWITSDYASSCDGSIDLGWDFDERPDDRTLDAVSKIVSNVLGEACPHIPISVMTSIRNPDDF